METNTQRVRSYGYTWKFDGNRKPETATRRRPLSHNGQHTRAHLNVHIVVPECYYHCNIILIVIGIIMLLDRSRRVPRCEQNKRVEHL